MRISAGVVSSGNLPRSCRGNRRCHWPVLQQVGNSEDATEVHHLVDIHQLHTFDVNKLGREELLSTLNTLGWAGKVPFTRISNSARW